MPEEKPDSWPEYKLFHSRRLGEVADLLRGVVHVVVDTVVNRHANPTPSEHFRDKKVWSPHTNSWVVAPPQTPLHGVQERANEWMDKVDMQDATPETAAEAMARDASDEAWERPSGW